MFKKAAANAKGVCNKEFVLILIVRPPDLEETCMAKKRRAKIKKNVLRLKLTENSCCDFLPPSKNINHYYAEWKDRDPLEEGGGSI